MAETLTINVGERTYIRSNDDFGIIVRPSFLGLQNAPVVQLDDGSLAGFAGVHALQEVVPLATGKNFADEPVTVPLDVKLVGIAVMDSMEIPSDTQGAMFIAFRALSKENRKALTDQWEQANTGSTEDQANFVTAMIAQLVTAGEENAA